MLRLSRNGIGVLTSQYKSVLKKCALLNMFAAGLFMYAPQAHAETGTNIDSLSEMGTSIGADFDYDKLYVNGNGDNNTAEMFSADYKRSWITNYGIVNIGYAWDEEKESEVPVDTTVSNKHSVPDTETYSDLTPTQGGGVVSNQNYYDEDDNIYGAQLRLGNTTFENNSVSDFATDSDYAVAAGGVVSNNSIESMGVNDSVFKKNYTMHFVNAEGGALYNGIIADPTGKVIGTAMIETSQNTFEGNHVGNEDFAGLPSSIRSAWKNSEYYSARTNGISDYAYGGAIFNAGMLESSYDTFKDNYAYGKYAAGGAIYNTFMDVLGSDSDDSYLTFYDETEFDGNYAYSPETDGTDVVRGGAIYNESLITLAENNVLTMTNNYALSENSAFGGAIYSGNDESEEDRAVIKTIHNATFKDNYARVTKEGGQSWGGAIYNDGVIILSDAEFEGNKAISPEGSQAVGAHGGAIANYGDFQIANDEVTKDIIFKNNDSSKLGGAIYNGSRGKITGTIANTMRFENNTDRQVSQDSETAEVSSGGAIVNDRGTIDLNLVGTGKIEFVTYGKDNVLNYGGTFKITGDHAITKSATEGDSMHTSVIDPNTTMINLGATFTGSGEYEITDTQLNLVDGGNDGTGYVGFVPAMKLTNVVVNMTGSNDSHMYLTSNNDTLEGNDFYILNEDAELYYGDYDPEYKDFAPADYIENHGTVIYDDQPQNDEYLKVLYEGEANPGDTDIKIADNVLNYGIISTVRDNFITPKVHIGTLDSKDGNLIFINTDNTKAGFSEKDTEHKLIPEAPEGYEFGTYTGAHYNSEAIVIDQTITGETNVTLVDMVGGEYDKITLDEGQRIYFAQTQKEEGVDEKKFSWNVTNGTNPDYTIKIGYDENGDVYDWFLYREGTTPPPPPPPPPVDDKIPPLVNIPRASLEQIRTIMLNIGKTNRSYCNCYQDQCNNTFCRMEQGSPKARLWATPFYRWGTFDHPFETDFKIYGLDFGLDYQPHTNDLFGLFGSYRKGNFDSDGIKKERGKIKNLVSDEKSELELKSMVAGAYYRHYMGNGYALGAVYAGKADADIEIGDDVTGSVDGYTYGAKIELGYDSKINRRTTLTPYGSVTYNYISYDDDKLSDDRKVKINKISDFELEAGAKFEYMFNNEHQLPTSAYVKPSIIQTITKGGKVMVDDKEYKDTLENETIGRVEVGADAYLVNNFAIGVFGNYSFGSDYKAWAVGGHLRYIW